MRRLSHHVFLSVLLAATATTPIRAFADAPDAEQIQRDLQCLVGTWRGEGEVEMGGAMHPVQFAYSCEVAAGGAGVACHLTMTGIEGFTYESNDLWGYDPGSGRLHWFTVSNAGETHDHAGTLENSAFVASYVGRRDGSPMRENVRFRFAGHDQLIATSVVYVAHQRVEALTVRMNREGGRVAQVSR